MIDQVQAPSCNVCVWVFPLKELLMLTVRQSVIIVKASNAGRRPFSVGGLGPTKSGCIPFFCSSHVIPLTPCSCLNFISQREGVHLVLGLDSVYWATHRPKERKQQQTKTIAATGVRNPLNTSLWYVESRGGTHTVLQKTLNYTRYARIYVNNIPSTYDKV